MKRRALLKIAMDEQGTSRESPIAPYTPINKLLDLNF
jgi:hypothetical protein